MTDPTGLTLSEQVAVLDEHIVASTVEAAMLRHEVVEERQARRTLGRVVIVLSVAVIFEAFLAVGISIVALQHRDTARRTNDAVRRVTEVQQTLVECTTPGNPLSKLPSDRVHECYDDGQRQRSESVAQVISGIVKGLQNAGASVPSPTP